MGRPSASDLVTVIVPIFDVEDHVAACIASLRAQTHTAFDVVMVDDGSTDASAARALEAAGDDPRFRLIRQDNAGLSAARNRGLDAATGAFVAFVDSDDRVTPDYLSALLAALRDAPDCPWVACAIRNRHPDGQTTVHSALFDAPDPALAPGCQRFGFRTARDVIRHYPSAWNKLYRRDFIGDLRFPVGVLFEDHAFYLRLALQTDSLLHLSDPLYEQTRGRAGQITETDSDRVFDQLEVLDDVLPLLARGPLPEGDAAAAALACRLLSERSRTVQAPARRAAFAARARDVLDRHGIRYVPDPAQETLATWGLEMDGVLPLSVVVPWDGGDPAPLRDSLRALFGQRGPGYELLVVCDRARDRAAVRDMIADLAPDWATPQEAPEDTHDGPTGGARVLVARGGSMGRARQAGLDQARGRYVVCLDAGDILTPHALQTRTEALLTLQAPVGLSARRHGIAGTPDAGFSADHVPAHRNTAVAFAPTPRQALAADLSISATIFERAFLDARTLRFADTGRHGEWPVVLGALMLCDTAAYLPSIDVAINPTAAARGVLSHPYAVTRLMGDHRRLCAALPAAAAARLPSGWPRRLMARALRVWLLDGPARGRMGRILATGGAAAVIAWRGMGRTDKVWPAGFDAQIGPKFARLFDTAGLLHLLRDRIRPRPHRISAPVITPRDTGAPHKIYAFDVGAGRATQAWARFNVQFQTAQWANLSFYTASGHHVPLHLSLRHNDGVISLNDTRPDGIWRAARQTRCALPPTGVDLVVNIRRNRLRLWVDGTPVRTLKPRRPWRRSGLTGLDRISHLLVDPDITPLDLIPQAAPPAGTDGMYLDSRLILRLTGPVTDRTRVTVDGSDIALACLPTPLPVDRPGVAARALVPARIWAGHPAGAPRLLRRTQAGQPDRTLTLTRADLAARISALMQAGLPASDADLAMRVIETVALAGLAPDLDAGTQADLARLAQVFDLGALVPDLVAPARQGPPTFADEVTDLAGRIRRAQTGAPLLEALPPDPAAARHLTLMLVEWAVDQGRMEDLYAQALEAGTLPAPLHDTDDPWTLSASLPFLWLAAREDDLLEALRRIAGPARGWRVTPAMAWVGDRALAADPAISAAGRTAALAHLLDWTEAAANDPWGRTACVQMTGLAARMLLARDSLPSGLARRIIWSMIAAYGLAPSFWDRLSGVADTDLPPPVALARAACADLHDSTDPVRQARALDRLDRLSARGIAAARVEYLGPAGVPLAPDATLTPADLLVLAGLGESAMGDAALRYMASPGTPPADPDIAAMVRDTILHLVPEQTPPPYLDLQHRIHGQITAYLAGTDPHPDPLGRLLAGLVPLSSAGARHLGLGLALTLVAGTADPAVRRRITDWVLARPVRDADVCRAPAVRMGLMRLAGDTSDAATALRAHLSPGSGQPPLPVLPAHHEDLPAPHPLNDVIVTVFSCHPFLDSRIPALRAGWLADLKAMGIPYVIIVGNGDGTLRGDVVHVDAPDDYEGLPAKTLATLDWVRRNTTYAHLFKIDDDCLVDAQALFGALSWRGVDYMGRRLTRAPGQMDRIWHQEKASTPRGRLELDKSPEPSTYADGGSGYLVSRDAMEAVAQAARSPEGRTLIETSFMEDKLLGDLLALRGIALSTPGYLTSVRRRTHSAATPVAYWNAGFYPSLAAPTQQVHMDTHLHQAEVRALRDQPVLEPRKIWPSFAPPRLGYQSNALELISPPHTAARARDADVAVVAVMRNEMFMLPQFLAHYRRLGVGCFIIADNVSDDGTREYLLDQDDVTLLSVDTDYNLSQYGVAWQQAMLHSFRKDRWSVVADADELLVWQAEQTQTLPDLLSGPAFAQADAARVFMLDMYPEGPLETAQFTTRTPFEDAGFADRVPFRVNPLTRGPYSDQTLYTSALRHRLIPHTRPDLFAAQKIALLKYRPHMRLSAGLHFVTGVRRADHDLIFGHFKYNADFFRKAQAEVARKQHFNNAEEYQKYLALAAEGRAQIHDADLSLPWDQVPFVAARLGRS